MMNFLKLDVYTIHDATIIICLRHVQFQMVQVHISVKLSFSTECNRIEVGSCRDHFRFTQITLFWIQALGSESEPKKQKQKFYLWKNVTLTVPSKNKYCTCNDSDPLKVGQ